MNNKEERILNSLTGLEKAAAPDFFYTRLMGRMQKEWEPKRKTFLLLRPAFVTSALLVVLMINVFSIMQFNKAPQQKATVQSGKPATLESFAEAYNMNTASVYE
ncbi:hypothetical protein [Ferruginibacter sp. SUN106]|uniref:hypothetical protein n=1 Tax=Ferruginibacter sp. SUN106 TaxID=2978348 RepID=UPI003D368BA8